MAPLSILILGIGELGYEVVKSLAEHKSRGDTRLTVLLRSHKPSRTETLKEWNVATVIADVGADSQDSLAHLFAAYNTVVSCVGMYLPPSTQVKIARAILAAGVPRYFPWQYGIDYDVIGKASAQDLFDSQLDVRALLRGQEATKWVIVSTGMFISFLFEPSFGIVNEGRDAVTAIGSWENAISVTAPRDIGRVVAELALVETQVQDVMYTAGDTVSMEEIAKVVEKVTGGEVKRILKTVDVLKRELEEAPGDAMRKYRVVFGEGRGVAWSKAQSFNETHGIQTMTVEQWARESLK